MFVSCPITMKLHVSSVSVAQSTIPVPLLPSWVSLCAWPSLSSLEARRLTRALRTMVVMTGPTGAALFPSVLSSARTPSR